MITKYEKANRGKLLVAVMALAVVLAGAAVIFSDSEVDAAEAYTLDTAGTVTVVDADGTAVEDSPMSLAAALAQADASGQTWTLKNGTYNVTKTESTRIGSGFVVNIENLTINGNGSTIYSNASNINSGASNGVNQSSTVTIQGNGTVLKNMTVMSMYVNNSTWNVMKSIEITGNNVTIDNVKISENTLATGYSEATIDYPGYGGSIVPVSSGTGAFTLTVKNTTITNGNISQAYLTGTGENKLIVENTSVSISIADVYGFNSNAYGSDSPTTQAVTYESKNNSVSIDDSKALATDIINGAPAGTTVNVNANVTLDTVKTTTVESGVTLIINEDVTVTGNITNNGKTEVYGTVKGNITGETGTIVADPAAVITGTVQGIIVPDADMEKPFYIGGILEVSQSIGNATLNDNLVIPEGLTLTVSGDLFLGSYSITVNGNLVIERNACIYGLGGSQGITLGTTGAIQNSGVIGNGNAVSVKASDESFVSMQGVSGLEFTVNKDAKLVISGDVSRISSVATNEFTIKGVVIDNLDVSNKVTMKIDGDVSVAKNATVNLNGTIADASTDSAIVLNNGSTVNVNGDVSVDVKAIVGLVGEGSKVTDPSYVTVEITNVDGITVNVGRINVAVNDSDSEIYQIAYLNGTIEAYSTETGAAPSAMEVDTDYTPDEYLSSVIYIATENDLTVGKGVALTIEDNVTVYGTIIVPDDAGTVAINSYIGAMYTITTGEGSSEETTTYYTSFEAALGVIDTVDEKTLEVRIDKIAGNVNVAADQVIDFKAATGSTVTVSSDAVVTIETDGSVNGITNVEGMVVVKDGGDCTIPKGGYAVRSVSADNTVTYAGLKVAISNAQPGDVIEIGAGSTTESLTIPAGVTVNVKESLDVGGDLTVSESAKLVIKGSLNMTGGTAEKPSKITVYGELDASEGTVTGNSFTLSSTGKTTVTALPDSYNGAYYQDGGDYVITSVASAVAYAAEHDIADITVNGTVTETADLSVDGVNIIVSGTVTLGNVSLKDSTISVTSGNVSGTFSGLTGDGTSTGVVELVKSTTKVSCTSTVDAAGATKYTTTIDGANGGVTIVSGTVVMKADAKITINPADEAYFKISSGATLQTASEVTFTETKKFIIIDGTMDIRSTVSFSGLTVAGTVNVNENGVLTIAGETTVTGTITVSAEENKEGTFEVNANLNVGAQPKTLGATTGSIVGAVDLDAGKAIIVYDGASVADAEINVDVNGNSAAKSTAFYVNNVLYATVYAISGVNSAVLNSEIAGIDGVKTTATEIVWTYGEEELDNTAATSTAIGKYAELRTEVEYEVSYIVVSAGPGLTIYIDEVRANGTTAVAVGEHTVTVYVNSGYEGTPSVTFNGQTITDGKFTITPDMIVDSDSPDKLVLAATGGMLSS